MRRFTTQWPQIEVMLEEHDDEEIADALERGELDVAFVLLPFGDAPLETVELLRDPYVCSSSRRDRRSPQPPSLPRSPSNRSSASARAASTDPIEAAFGPRVEPRWAFRLERQPDGAGPRGREWAARSCLLTVDTGDPRIVAVDLRGAVEPRVVGIGRHRDRYASPAARAFIETALAAESSAATRR